jgi:hypothetical protein
MKKTERRRLVETGGTVYMPSGIRANLAGWADPDSCGVYGPTPGFWRATWETVAEVVMRPDKRFRHGEVWKVGGGWLGYPPEPGDFQAEVDL